MIILTWDDVREWTTIKLFWLLTWFGVFIAPVYQILGSLAFLMICDAVSGVWAAVKTEGKTAIKFKKGLHSFVKLFMYSLVLVSGVAAESMFSELPLTRVASGFIAAREIRSIYRNASVVLGFDLWENMLTFYKNNKHLLTKIKK